MPRLPAELARGTLAEKASHQGRDFAEGLRRDKVAQSKMFAATLRAARTGPLRKQYVPPAEIDSWSSRELKRMLKADIGKMFTPKRASAIELWHQREIARAIKGR